MSDMNVSSFPVKDIYRCVPISTNGVITGTSCLTKIRWDPDTKYALCSDRSLLSPLLDAEYNNPTVTTRMVSGFVIGTLTPTLANIGLGLLIEKLVGNSYEAPKGSCFTVDPALSHMKMIDSPPGIDILPPSPGPYGASSIRNKYCTARVTIANFLVKTTVACGFKVLVPAVCDYPYFRKDCPSITYEHNSSTALTYTGTQLNSLTVITASVTSLTFVVIGKLLDVLWFDDVGFCAAEMLIRTMGAYPRVFNCIFSPFDVPQVQNLQTAGSGIKHTIETAAVNAFTPALLLGLLGLLVNYDLWQNHAPVCVYKPLPDCNRTDGCLVTIEYANDAGTRVTNVSYGHSPTGLGLYNNENDLSGLSSDFNDALSYS